MISQEVRIIGDYSYLHATAFEEQEMPTAIHELSPRAVIFRRPVSSTSPTEWRNAPLADTVTPAAILLQTYFADAGFTPLSSEWWHFTDLESADTARALGITGEYAIQNIYSVTPLRA